jgi:hypothetical protein
VVTLTLATTGLGREVGVGAELFITELAILKGPVIGVEVLFM